MKPSEVISFAKENGAKMVDLKFSDLPGMWQHLSIPVAQLTEEAFENGFGFDGSSVRGWRNINESDMIIMPDPTAAQMDPFMEVPTLSIICDIVLPDTLEAYNRDPRQIAKRALNYLKSTGIADTAYFGPEAEFFIFTKWILKRPLGTLDVKKAAATLVISLVTKKVTFQHYLRTNFKILELRFALS